MDELNVFAAEFEQKLKQFQSGKDREKNARFAPATEGSKVLGVRHKHIFDLAKTFAQMPLGEIEKLLESPYYEIRMGAVSIMDFQVQRKKIPSVERKALYDLYLNRHDRIDNWDLVDRAAKRVVGGYLYECGQPWEVLFQLAKSKNVWERRTAIVATSYFIGKGELDPSFQVGEILVNDEHDLIQKAVGGWIREAGKKDQARLTAFLNRHAKQMPRTMVRYAAEKLPIALQNEYLAKGAGG